MEESVKVSTNGDTSGAVAICPHCNTANFQGALADNVWLRGDLELVSRSDALLLTPDWQRSSGTKDEVRFARDVAGIPVLYSVLEMKHWLKVNC